MAFNTMNEFIGVINDSTIKKAMLETIDRDISNVTHDTHPDNFIYMVIQDLLQMYPQSMIMKTTKDTFIFRVTSSHPVIYEIEITHYTDEEMYKTLQPKFVIDGRIKVIIPSTGFSFIHNIIFEKASEAMYYNLIEDEDIHDIESEDAVITLYEIDKDETGAKQYYDEIHNEIRAKFKGLCDFYCGILK